MMNNDPVIWRLLDLVRVCRDGETIFRDAALAAFHNHLRTLFYNYSQQRGQLAAELYQELRRLGGDFHGGESSARMRRCPRHEQTLRDRDDDTILSDCLHEVSHAAHEYEQALAEIERPASARQVVHRQHAAIQAARERIEELAADRTAEVTPAEALVPE